MIITNTTDATIPGKRERSRSGTSSLSKKAATGHGGAQVAEENRKSEKKQN